MYHVNNGPCQLRIALLGNPCVFHEWTLPALLALRELGFNAVQLNLAWLRRPFDEPLNLRDVVTAPGESEEPAVAQCRAQLKQRAALAKQAGLRTIFHFGSPFMWRNPYTGEICRFGTANAPDIYTTDDPWFETLNPLVVEYEASLLQEFRRQFDQVDDILVYTFDQDSWKPSEFGNGRLSRGIPLHERLPGYLATIHQLWTQGREDSSILWWEPWELSAGQIYRCLPSLPRTAFGLMLHNNIAEAQLTKPVDVWFRNTARVAKELGIPVVGEGFFASMTEEIEPLSIPCPRLVDEELQAIISVPGVVGIKEYFGLLPQRLDPNQDMVRERLADPQAVTGQLLEKVTARFGASQGAWLRMLGLLADGLQFFPWDASWFARLAGMADIDHGWSAATVRGQMVESPSWESTRRCHFMMTDDRQPHPFLLEDVQLRCELAAENMAQALAAGQELLQEESAPEVREMLERTLSDVDRFRRVTRSYALHLRETNVAYMLRQDLEAGRPLMPRLVEEMTQLLQADVENQHGRGRVVTMLNLFQESPERFIKTHLLPTEATILEKGHHTLTTR